MEGLTTVWQNHLTRNAGLQLSSAIGGWVRKEGGEGMMGLSDSEAVINYRREDKKMWWQGRRRSPSR
ncbi:hypothetical protein LSTR_LSTR016761 [Laodelphax striatellus]|uniref:Uncharacterized protein n=1 Tax=Laodelphax striatellus TaxID=195883 RepID=A0A482XFY1_LAOST|nr:hypothetical protein LSTR_LSTR016761 [Laodelphax striatellus]